MAAYIFGADGEENNVSKLLTENVRLKVSNKFDVDSNQRLTKSIEYTFVYFENNFPFICKVK